MPFHGTREDDICDYVFDKLETLSILTVVSSTGLKLVWINTLVEI